MKYSDIKFDCSYFRSDIPCLPNKEKGEICNTCTSYKKIENRILILKLGALGDVIRTTPILSSLREKYPNSHITWVTHSPAILPQNSIDKIIKFSALEALKLEHTKFDVVFNLDKDVEVCQLIDKIDAKQKFGYGWQDFHITGLNGAAQEKLITGMFDSISQANTKSYLEEIFAIADLKFDYQDYEINLNEDLKSKWENKFKALANGKPIVGLNTGCGPRWKTRLWPEENWIAFVKELKKQGYFVVVLGGKDEDEKNSRIANQSGAYYPGHFSLEEFISISANMDLIVTQVSMMMHIATALKTKLVLMNNIFNMHEFELYGRGEIIEPTSGCDCYFGTKCTRETSCMFEITVDNTLKLVNKYLVVA